MCQHWKWGEGVHFICTTHARHLHDRTCACTAGPAEGEGVTSVINWKENASLKPAQGNVWKISVSLKHLCLNYACRVFVPIYQSYRPIGSHSSCLWAQIRRINLITSSLLTWHLRKSHFRWTTSLISAQWANVAEHGCHLEPEPAHLSPSNITGLVPVLKR